MKPIYCIRLKNILIIAFALILLCFCVCAASVSEPDGLKLYVLMYHQVSEKPSKYGNYVVSPAELENDIKIILDEGYTPIFASELLNYAENKSKELSLLLIIDSIEKLRSKYNIEDIIVIEKNVNDEIVSLDFDNTKINEFNLKVSENIQKKLIKLEKNKKNNLTEKYYEGKVDIIYNVPMSIVYDVPILVGIGPKVPFKLDVLGNVFT